MKILIFSILVSFICINWFSFKEKDRNEKELCTSLIIKIDEDLSDNIKNVVFYNDDEIVFGKYFYGNEKTFNICNSDNINGIHINFGKRIGFFKKSYHFITQNKYESSRPKRFINYFDFNYTNEKITAKILVCENINKYDFLDYTTYVFSPIFYPLGILPYEYKRLCIEIDQF